MGRRRSPLALYWCIRPMTNATMRFALAPARLRWAETRVASVANDGPELGLEPLEEPADPFDERPVLAHQRFAEEHARDSGVLLREPEHHADDPLAAQPRGIGSSATIRFTSPNTASSANSMSASNIAALPGK